MKETGGGTDFSSLAQDLMSPQYSTDWGYYSQAPKFEFGQVNPIIEKSPQKEHDDAYKKFGPESPLVATNEGHQSLVGYNTQSL